MKFTMKVSVPALIISLLALVISLVPVIHSEIERREFVSSVCETYWHDEKNGSLGLTAFYDDSTVNLCSERDS